MSRFNQKQSPVKSMNFAGGESFDQYPELELVSILLTSFGQDQYYRSSDDTFQRLKELIAVCDKKLVAQAIIFARTKFGMRSISHVAASELAKHIGGKDWAKNFFKNVIYRPDDITEILSYHKAKNGTISHAMRKGLAKAFDKFDAYSLAKYRGSDKAFKLIDAVNLCHPEPVENNAEALAALVKGELKSFDTWETNLSAAGSDSKAKAQVWTSLLTEKKLGYLALLRNLRNIMEQAPDVLQMALESLTSRDFIRKSLIFPFQYLTAYKQFESMNTRQSRIVMEALSKAVDISCENVKELGFTGNTLVAVDNSSSMDSPVTNSEHMKKSELGALFGIVFAKAINGDIMEFGDTSRYISYTLNTDSMDFAAGFQSKNKVGHGTNFHSIFENADKKYDRILIFSDMQGWMGYYAPTKPLSDYKKRFDANPFVYSFDLAGYGTMQFPENKVFCMAGFSDKIFDQMRYLETDKNALLTEIKKIVL